ncbi:MAG: cell envelope integrity protein TolA [Proteobacteria bacterium]|nr:cell envelope integrity protein TolA [Pseudomonadota bacterium]
MEFLREHMVAVLLSVLLHGALIGVLVFGLDLPSNRRALAPTEQVAIEATVVDETLIRQEMARLDALEQEEQRLREEQQRQALEEQRRAEQQAEEARRQLEQEQQRLEQLQEQREEAERQEQLRLAELERRREAEEEAAREAERQRLAEEQRQREEEERRRQEELERQRRAAEEARRQAEAQAELARALAAEEEARRREEAAALDEYIRLIENRIQQNWIPPASAQAGIQCTVHVTQIPSGDVVDVRVGQCNGDEAVVRSIEAAVLRSSPLPRPRISSLFDRNLEVIFRPEV